MTSIIAIFLGGGLGSLARFGVGKMAKSLFDTGFPLGTLIANALASGILAVLIYLFHDKIDEGGFLKPLLVVGFCGGFSTFSTFSQETVALFQNGQTLWGILNIGLSITLCVLLVWWISRLSA